jgi:ABC-type glutathione transport system ATPase component
VHQKRAGLVRVHLVKTVSANDVRHRGARQGWWRNRSAPARTAERREETLKNTGHLTDAIRLTAVRKLCGKRDNQVVALEEVTTRFGRGTFTAIMGSSGSGKDDTTLDVRVAALFPAPDGYDTLLPPADTLAARTTEGHATRILVKPTRTPTPNSWWRT